MNHHLLIVLLSLLLLGPTAGAQSIYAGSPTGSYTNDFCPMVVKAVRKEYFQHRCVTSQGTGDNIQKVLADPTSIGIGQLDVLAGFIEAHPGQLTVVDPNIGFECLFAVTRDPAVIRLGNLAPRMPIALPPERSGSTASFSFLQSLDRSLAELRDISYYDSALTAVKAVTDGDAALAFFVQAANVDNPVFEAINEAELTFVPVVNRQILRREAAGINVYEPREVGVTPTLFGFGQPEKVITTCTPVVLFTGNPGKFPADSTAREDQEVLVKALTITERPETGGWKSIFQNMVQVGREKLEPLF